MSAKFAASALAFALLLLVWVIPGEPPLPCQEVDATTLTAAEVEGRLATGWFSLPGDGAEVIYSEACN